MEHYLQLKRKRVEIRWHTDRQHDCVTYIEDVGDNTWVQDADNGQLPFFGGTLDVKELQLLVELLENGTTTLTAPESGRKVVLTLDSYKEL